MTLVVFGMARLVTFGLWLLFAAAALIVGLVYGLEVPAGGGEGAGRQPSEQQAGVLYSALLADLRFARAQQWSVAYLTVVLLAAVAALTRFPAVSASPLVMEWVLPLLADSIWGFAVIAVLVFQRSQQMAHIGQSNLGLFLRHSLSWMDDDSYDEWSRKSTQYSLHFAWPLLFIALATAAWLAVEYLLGQ